MADKNDEKEEKAKRLAELRRKYGFLGGRPVKFKNPKALLDKLFEYLLYCYEKSAPTTIEGFCTFAGITKTTFYEYREKKSFTSHIENFRTAVEAYFVEQCADGRPGNKADFILKNAFKDDWKDEKTTQLKGSFDVTGKLPPEIEALIVGVAGDVSEQESESE
ncbi:MAG: terminase small subunit [Alphaproteobacteria bacterium]|nr:terminase small subunit [Alphaproteobacteria bacterium]